MYRTIRHNSTRRTIVAYLSLFPYAIDRSRIVRYMYLMHSTAERTTASMLHLLTTAGIIAHVRHGWYQMPALQEAQLLHALCPHCGQLIPEGAL